MTITDQIGGSFLTIGPFTGVGVATIPGSYTAVFGKAFLVMDYTNIGGAVDPIFTIAPPTGLDFGGVEVGSSAILQATVSNTGSADLIISDVTSSDAEFTFAPNTFPITITPGNDQIFDVTFAPIAEVTYSGLLTFTHNAAGSPFDYSVQGIGTAPGLVNLENTFTASDGSAFIPQANGLDATATNGIDPALGETDLPPFPPAGVFECRFDLLPYAGSALSSYKDYRFAADPSTFVGSIEHTLWFQTSAPGIDITLDYDLHPNATMFITDQIGGTFLSIGPFTGSGTATLPGSYTAVFGKAFMVIDYASGPVPEFDVTPASLDFGDVYFGSSSNLNVTVSNTGGADLIISSAAIAELDYTVTPATATVLPGGSEVFTVTFTPPSVGGPFTGTLVFTHNAAGSPDNVSLTGNGIDPPLVSGLIFEMDTVWYLEEDFYSETMQLVAPPGPNVQALQFRLLVNRAPDDETILTFTGIDKGGDVSDPSWVLDYNIFRGDINANGASDDTVYVLLYNLNQDGGLAGNALYPDLLEVHFRVADLPALQDSIKSSFLIENAEASTFEGFPIDITPLPTNELVVWGMNRVGSWGDVNGDGCLDILDLIMVVDHIVGRDSLDVDEFARADIAPWTPGVGTVPSPDGFVNVQDLALIQNIILTGFFPDGTPVGGCPSGLAKFNGEADAILNLYINNEGITAYLDSKIGIRGAQIEFGNMIDNPENMVINTELGDGFYLKVEEMLRTLMYDRLAEKYVEAGSFEFMADMPFGITNPTDISLDKVVLVDINQRKVMKLEVNLIYSTPTLPYDYILFQNYPNPFNPSTSVRFQVPQTGNVTIRIYDMLGQEIRTLFAGEVTRGTYTANWDGLNDSGIKMSSGSYIYRMIAGDFVQAKKMILLK
ncbi:MAG: Coagulation factor protein [Ignavibacteriae bacterium]|nr:MAG: Coagulation factor protein [Ignavibacteriota bacterium]